MSRLLIGKGDEGEVQATGTDDDCLRIKNMFVEYFSSIEIKEVFLCLLMKFFRSPIENFIMLLADVFFAIEGL